MKTNCKNCGKEFIVGINGLGNGLCDICAEVKRDKNGLVWENWEEKREYIDPQTGESWIVYYKDICNEKTN